MKLVVIDYESGNLRSVTRALQTHGVSPVVTGDPAELETRTPWCCRVWVRDPRPWPP